MNIFMEQQWYSVPVHYLKILSTFLFIRQNVDLISHDISAREE